MKFRKNELFTSLETPRIFSIVALLEIVRSPEPELFRALDSSSRGNVKDGTEIIILFLDREIFIFFLISRLEMIRDSGFSREELGNSAPTYFWQEYVFSCRRQVSFIWNPRGGERNISTKSQISIRIIEAEVGRKPRGRCLRYITLRKSCDPIVVREPISVQTLPRRLDCNGKRKSWNDSDGTHNRIVINASRGT